MKQIKIFLLLLTVAILGCSKGEDPIDPNKKDPNKKDPVKKAKVVLSTAGGKTEFSSGTGVVFEVKENGKDVSSKAEVYVADKKITKNAHTFQEEGEYEVYAKYNGTKSNTIKIKITKKGTVASGDVVVSIEGGNDNIKQGETRKIIVKYKGKVAGDGTYELYVNKEFIEGSSYTFKVAGKMEITATYYTEKNEAIPAKKLTINVAPDGKKRSYTQNVLIQKLTATWCVRCATPSLDHKELIKKYNQMIAIEVHGNSTSGNKDPFAYPNIDAFKNSPFKGENGGLGYPTTRFMDFNKDISNYVEVPMIESYTKNKTILGLAINYNLANKKVNVKVGYDDIPSNTKLVVYLVEDKLTGSQANEDNGKKGLSGYGKGNPIPNFEYNNVLRASLTKETGDVIKDSDIKNNQYSKEFTVNTAGAKVANNTKIIAYVIDSNNQVINVQVAKANENKNFEK